MSKTDMNDIMDRMSDEKKKNDNFKDNVKKNGFDYYAILGFINLSEKEKKDLSIKEIKKSFNKKLRKYHPDHIEKNKVSTEEFETLKHMYKLVQQAGSILTNKEKKLAYDLQNNVIINSGFLNQKKGFENFMDLQLNNNSEENKKNAKLEFEKNFNDLEKIHGSDKLSVKSISNEDASRKLEDLLLQREVDELEYKPKNIFENKSFNSQTFNKEFLKSKKKKEKKDDNKLITYNEINALNSDNSFVNIDDDYSKLYTNEKNNLYSSIESSESEDSDVISSIDSDEIQMEENTLTKDQCDSALEKLINERNDENNEFSNVDDLKSAFDDKFGISSNLGFMVGTDFQGSQLQNKNIINDNELDAYKKLLDYDK